MSGTVLRFPIDESSNFARRFTQPGFSIRVAEMVWDDFVRLVPVSRYRVGRSISNSFAPSACRTGLAHSLGHRMRGTCFDWFGVDLLEFFRVQDRAIRTSVYLQESY